jgi:hypothetical protein
MREKEKLAKLTFLKFRLHIYFLQNNRIIGGKSSCNPHGCWVLYYSVPTEFSGIIE